MRLVKTVDGQVVPERWKCISFSLRIMKISGHTNGSVDQLIGRQVPILSNKAPILYPSIHIIKSLSIVVVDDTFKKQVLVKICESVIRALQIVESRNPRMEKMEKI